VNNKLAEENYERNFSLLFLYPIKAQRMLKT